MFLGRNLARQNCLTYYTLSTDIDIIPSTNTTRQLSYFLNGNTCAKVNRKESLGLEVIEA